MKSLKVNIPGKEYDIFIEIGLIDKSGEMIKSIFDGEKIAVVTDSNVNPLYGERVK